MRACHCPGLSLTNDQGSRAGLCRWEIAKVVSGVTYYPVQDYIGSMVKVTDVSRATVFSVTNYYPWGKANVTLNTHPESLKFTSMPYDSVTGLYFFGTRFYDPTIGRFVQQDSFAGVPSNPLSLNRYAYAGDNPMTFSDPSGHLPWATIGLDLIFV